MPFTHLHTTTQAEFIAAAADILQSSIESAIANDGAAIIGLSGGSTPRLVYEALGKREIDWNAVHVFLVDERFVPANHADANQKLIRETLLTSAKIPERNLVFPDTGLAIEDCIATYTRDLQSLWDKKLPDVVTLGLGSDGHIASLFPPLGDDALDDLKLVLHTTTDAFAVHDRISISLNAIAASGSQIVLLSGTDKKAVWEEMLGSKKDERRWPLKRVLEGEEVVIVSCW